YPDLPPPTPDETSARTRLFEAASSLIAAFAERSETVVFFVDDLQWADAATLDFLRYAARRWAEDASPVLLVANLRAEALELDTRLSGWWAGVSRDLPALRLSLETLSGEDTVRLLEALVDADGEGEQAVRLDRLGRWLHAETGGQPFFLTETLGTLMERGVLVPGPGGGSVLGVAAFEEEALRGLLPARVRDMIRARMANLGGGAAELLSAAAVLGSGFGFEQVCRVAGLGENECLPALDEGLASGLLREVAGAPDDPFGEDAYAFTHDRVRDVAYTEARSARRRLFHRRALEVLTEEGAPAAELARHAFAAVMAEETFRHSLAAGDQALALFATEDAIFHYERARKLTRGPEGRLAPVEPPVAELERLYVNLGRAHELVGRWDEAREVYEAMRTHGRWSGKSALEWSALNRLAILSAQRSFDSPATVGLLEDALAIARASDDRVGVAETEWNLSQMHAHGLEVEAAIAHGERALRLARELGSREREARTLATLATAHSFAGRWEECAVNAREGAALYAAMDGSRAEATGALSAQYILAGSPPSATSSNRAMYVQCLCLLSGGEVHRGSPEAGVEAGREGLEISRKLNNEWTLVHSIADLTQGLLDVGEYEEALRNTREGVEVARGLPIPNLFFFTLTALGNAYQALLALEEAREAYEEALAVAEATASPKWKAFVAPHLCANRALANDWGGAHAYAKEAVAAREEMPAALIWMDFERHYETEALLRGGGEELARENVRRLGEGVGDNVRYRIPYLRSLAVLSWWEGDETAIERLLEAKALAEEIGLPGELWQIWAETGKLHEQRGERERARDAFSRAARIVETLAGEIEDEVLKEGFLSAPQLRRVLEQG
ncbi:MAG: AAA family ATPase, partial [Actinomycetota bacterium]|nr:AAA family ATPase [Actinomycetota bacterium]